MNDVTDILTDTVLNQVLNTASSGIAILDKNFNVLKMNEALSALLKISMEDAVNQKCFNVLRGSLCNTSRCPLFQISNGRERLRIKVKKILPDGTAIPFILTATPLRQKTGKLVGIIQNFESIRELEHSEEKQKGMLNKLQRTMDGAIRAMATIVETKDPYTSGHQEQVAQIASAIASKMGLSEEKVKGVWVAAFIHDIGKIYVPSEILSKPGRFTDAEFNMIKAHPEIGSRILKNIEFSWPVAEIVLQHHERMDGSGYPQGLTGDNILLEARILSVADVVDAMSSHRPYRPALGIKAALAEISSQKSKYFDPKVVKTCLNIYQNAKR